MLMHTVGLFTLFTFNFLNTSAVKQGFHSLVMLASFVINPNPACNMISGWRVVMSEAQSTIFDPLHVRKHIKR